MLVGRYSRERADDLPLPNRRSGKMTARIHTKTLAAMFVAIAVAANLMLATEPAGAVVPDANGKIFFASNQDGNEEIYSMDQDGSGQKRLTFNTAFDFDPAISLDASKVAFSSDRSGDLDIWVMNSDTSGAPELLTTNSGFDVEPSWSPDGTKIVFTSSVDGKQDIYVMNANGSGTPAHLTSDPAGLSVNEQSPGFSPDGTKKAFQRVVGSEQDIWVMNADGSGETPLTATAFRESKLA
jgi:Tol biopolymer transport system component